MKGSFKDIPLDPSLHGKAFAGIAPRTSASLEGVASEAQVSGMLRHIGCVSLRPWAGKRRSVRFIPEN